MRVRLDLAYDGTAFSGWAAQPGLRTVEGELTAALETVLRVPVRLTVAGRTDAGVHAAAQVAHLDVPMAAWASLPGRSSRSPQEALLSRVHGLLAHRVQQAGRGTPQGPPAQRQPQLPAREVRGVSDVVVHGVQPVPAAFDARFSALERRYTYRISDDPQLWDPAQRRRVLWVDRPLDVEAMRTSALPLLGEHDFLSFCKPRAGATTVRTLKRLEWRREEAGPEAGLVMLSVVADAFCHSMVRSLVGAGLAVGQGRRSAAWPEQLLAARSRQEAAPVAPPHGLTLEAVSYPPEELLAEQAARARVVRATCC
ncbi:tRNA pseudouridine synthase A [Actinomyces bovis]|uniref:tRNA pseudouridine synthase A n=1 Tax=Actinomyces bovis TaxID=1658 RepID=A0ABY1VLA6_9ACTO|nr:tRNA pseudouridine synthase A [Actinomyces bovis]VEG54998.1 tRNA pseudouridine synthase A [Actinomyces israelii]